jgi:3-dehydroquinate dehydratase
VRILIQVTSVHDEPKRCGIQYHDAIDLQFGCGMAHAEIAIGDACSALHKLAMELHKANTEGRKPDLINLSK